MRPQELADSVDGWTDNDDDNLNEPIAAGDLAEALARGAACVPMPQGPRPAMLEAQRPQLLQEGTLAPRLRLLAACLAERGWGYRLVELREKLGFGPGTDQWLKVLESSSRF